MRYIIHRNGEILQSGSCQPEDFQYIGDASSRLEGIGSRETHYVKDGAIIPYTPVERMKKAQAHGPDEDWSNDAMDYIKGQQ